MKVPVNLFEFEEVAKGKLRPATGEGWKQGPAATLWDLR